jgi:hypothetical protein
MVCAVQLKVKAAMRQLIDTFGPKHSGNFYNYDGREYPW